MVRKKLIAVLIGSTLAGCANPVGVRDPRSPSQEPTFNGVGWFGSGSRVDTDSTSASNSSTTSSSTATTTGTGWFGSGS